MMQRRISSCRPSIFLLHLLLAGVISPAIEAGDSLIPGKPLYDDGTTLISSGGRFELGFFSAAGSGGRYIGIWYRNISQTIIVWVANSWRPIGGGSGRLSLSGEGTLVITNNSSTTIWSSSNVTRLTNPEATLFDDGNFAVREAGNDDPDSFAWQSFDFPTNTLLPGMKLGWDMTSGLNRKLTSWAGANDPTPGNSTLGIDLQGDPQLFLWFRTQQLWRGGPWNGLHFSGAPDMDDPILFNGTFVADRHQVIYSFGLRDPSTISVLVVDQAGFLQRLVWNSGTVAWDVVWYVPKDPCDVASACGVNAVCNLNASQVCSCLSGLLVSNSFTWSTTNRSPYGCSRASPVNCRTDGFHLFTGAKLPDTSRSVVQEVGTLFSGQCRELCSRNCSCTAYANLDESETGCIMWMGDIDDLSLYDNTGRGQDLYVRLADFKLTADQSNQMPNESSGRNYLAVMIAVPVVAIFLLVCIAFYFCRRRHRKRKNYDVKELEVRDLDLPLFDLDTVLGATNNFAAENKLGQGGFGPVYKGMLVDGQVIAVKRLSQTSTQGINEFKNEVMTIAKLQHQNLVRLLGCCIQEGERMLIYEYMPNGSLDAFLFDKGKPVLLNWKTRYNIIIGVARGLLYLHHDSRLKIIHRDMKTSNILLDKDNTPKISDFGLARILRNGELEINTRKVVGTYGYMSPEYAMNGFFSIKSDVFSFGVLILEIISGKKNREFYESDYINLLGHIWSLWEESKSFEIIDKSIDSFSVVEVMRCMKIGLLCVQERPQDRPTMSMVVTMLDSDDAVPEPKQPGFVAALNSSDSSIGKQYPLSINNVSNTTLEGR